MFDKLGVAGILGVVLLLGGVAIAAWQDLIIAGALALVIAGLGLIVYGMVMNLVKAMGMGDFI